MSRADRLKSHLEARGWKLGSLQERGQVFTFFREDEYSGIGAQLSFSGMSITDTYQMVTMEQIRFYRAGKVLRGHYQTDEINAMNELFHEQIPLRSWFECVNDINGALV